LVEVERTRSLERSLDLRVGSTVFLLARLLHTFFTNAVTSRFILARKAMSVGDIVRVSQPSRFTFSEEPSYLFQVY
jgi:hypothetical protein